MFFTNTVDTTNTTNTTTPPPRTVSICNADDCFLAAPGKGGAKKGDAASGDKVGVSGGGAAGARRANVSELKGLVEVRASSQATRAGAAAVTGEGRPLLQVRAGIADGFGALR